MLGSESVSRVVQVPKYGVMTAYEDELGQYLDNIKIWGIDVFKISEFSNNRPLTAVTYRVFQVSESRITLYLITLSVLRKSFY